MALIPGDLGLFSLTTGSKSLDNWAFQAGIYSIFDCTPMLSIGLTPKMPCGTICSSVCARLCGNSHNQILLLTPQAGIFMFPYAKNLIHRISASKLSEYARLRGAQALRLKHFGVLRHRRRRRKCLTTVSGQANKRQQKLPGTRSVTIATNNKPGKIRCRRKTGQGMRRWALHAP